MISFDEISTSPFSMEFIQTISWSHGGPPICLGKVNEE